MPVKTSFQVDLEINEDKFGQSGDRILSSHMHVTIVLMCHIQCGAVGPYICLDPHQN